MPSLSRRAALVPLLLASTGTVVHARAVADTRPAASGTFVRKGDSTFLHSALAGGAAAATATVAFHPIDTLKTVMQRSTRPSGLRPAVAALGARGLYRGVVPAALSMMPACAVRMGAYESAKRFLLRLRDEGRLQLPASYLIAFASATSVVVSVSVRAPLDLVKTQERAEIVPLPPRGVAPRSRAERRTHGRVA